jgi:hypothetical protein
MLLSITELCPKTERPKWVVSVLWTTFSRCVAGSGIPKSPGAMLPRNLRDWIPPGPGPCSCGGAEACRPAVTPTSRKAGSVASYAPPTLPSGPKTGYHAGMPSRPTDALSATNADSRPRALGPSQSRAPWTATPSAALVSSVACFSSRERVFPHPFRTDKRKMFRRGHSRNTRQLATPRKYHYFNGLLHSLSKVPTERI